MRSYNLYKEPVQYELVHTIQYLHSQGIHLGPRYCIEQNHPTWVVTPSIETENGDRYIGLDACIRFFESTSGISNLAQKAAAFNQENPDYRIKSY
jgi:hypothetical protein